MPLKTNISPIVALFFIFAVAAGVGSLLSRMINNDPIQLPKEVESEQVVCTQDAKACSDGSYMSRTGPNCEFAACPSSTPAIIEYRSGAYFSDFTLITGQVIRLVVDDESNVVVEVAIRGDDGLTEFWVEYGTNPENLDRATAHEASHLGMVSQESYGNFTRLILESDLQPEALYFYRAVGLKNGVKIYSGISSFYASK